VEVDLLVQVYLQEVSSLEVPYIQDEEAYQPFQVEEQNHQVVEAFPFLEEGLPLALTSSFLDKVQEVDDQDSFQVEYSLEEVDDDEMHLVAYEREEEHFEVLYLVP